MSYEVKLDTFEGPLDLLLHLVSKNEMDIYDISMSCITAQYLRYLEQVQEQNLDVASEFLVMAATLMHIKSRMLLPKAEPEEFENEEIDPRAELVQRLLEYRRYKEGAQQLEEYPQLNREVFVRPETVNTVDDGASSAVSEVGVYELVKALRELLKEPPEPIIHAVVKTPLSVADGIQHVLQCLRQQQYLPFRECFCAMPQRDEIIITFIAVLELVKLQLCKIVQLNQHGMIYLYPSDAVRSGRVTSVDGIKSEYH
ncbi:MAG: segregation/condensation protein A [Desulfuromonas sp.]|nr:segregation/condensation protein A [Desulfuromonas sp.]